MVRGAGMDSTSRQVMTMKYEHQLELDGSVELGEVNLLRQTPLNCPNVEDPPPPPLFSKSSSLDEMGVLHGESSHSLIPSLDKPTPSALLSNSSNAIAQQSDPTLGSENSVHKSKSVESGTPQGSSLTINNSTSSKLKVERLTAPALFDSFESGLGKDMMTIMSLLHPPQVGSSKVQKRGPGRPRKDAFTPGKIQRVPSGQKKNLLGGVRGRKKSSMDSLVGGSNLSLSAMGESSLGESPPRGADDTAESDSSSVASSLEKLHEDFSLFPEPWPGKVCGFCSLGERSMLGQGELLRLELREDFDPVAVSKGFRIRVKSEDDNTADKNSKPGAIARRQKGCAKIKRLVSQSSLESVNEPADEIVGHAEEPDYSTVFEAGFFYVHQQCASWCNGVETKEDGSFRNLETELVRSLNQRCHHCGNFGAGLVCRVNGCDVILHFPCAALSGAFQNSASRSLACFSHLDCPQSLLEVVTNCTVCDSRDDIGTLVMCSSCGAHYHGSCMAVNSDPAVRAGWQCPACKLCQACRQPGEESKLLSCDTCDKAYHIFCIRPALSSIPKHSWKCKMCRICTDCGARTPGSGPSSRWHANFSVCDSCYQQRNKGLACPLCGKAYRHVAQKLMLQCHLCKKYVHGTCDPAADLTTYQQRKELYPDYEYICIPCKAAGTGLNTSGGNPRVLSSLKRTDKEENEEGIVISSLAASQDSLWSQEDDSFPGMETGNDLMWLDKCLSTTLIDDIKASFPLPQPPIKEKLVTNQEKLSKKKLMPGRPKGVDKLGQLPPQSNSRKNRLNDFAKKRGPKPKLRLFGSSRVCLSRNSTDGFSKSDEEPGVENRMVLCSAKDEFVLQQDVCVMCGAFGCDLEGRLISCAQCGQCYHPYCVNVKVTKVVLLKGWRCLDCTVCEGCGQRNDESRLILCDECDVSFHIYCIDPPLEHVPHGTWKCKWCAMCYQCGNSDPGYNSAWHESYTKCGPCASQITCPVCSIDYNEGDLVIKCFQCERWLHSLCDMIKDADDAEKCADDGYCCVLCRPSDTLPPHLRPPPKAITPKVESPPKSPVIPAKSGSQFLIDGVYLSDFGVNQIKSLTLDIPRKKRKKVVPIADMEAGILAAIESVVSGGDSKEDVGEKDKDSKKRQRNLQKLGIGGFLVRLRAPRYKEEDHEGSDLSALDGEKPKRKPQRRKVKNKLVETFPVYLQEAFFGKSLMEPNSNLELATTTTEDQEPESLSSLKVENTIKLSKEEIQEIEDIKARKTNDSLKTSTKEMEKNSKQSKETKHDKVFSKTDGDGDLPISEILPISGGIMDNVLVNSIMASRTQIKLEDNLVDNQRERLENPPATQLDRTTEEHGQKDEFSEFLSTQFNFESDSGLPSMDSKDVEDIFKGVLVEESQDNSFPKAANIPTVQPKPTLPTGLSVPSTPSVPNSSIIQSTTQVNPSVGRNVPVQQNLSSPVSFPPPSPYHSEYSNSPQFSPAFSEPPSPWPAPATEDTDQPSSYNQRSILKWEADEALGSSATISAVLYANMKHPELKRDYQTWAERSKQIAKIWRGLSAEARAPFLQQARENRAASRMQKAQQMPKDMRGGTATPGSKEASQVPSPKSSLPSPKLVSSQTSGGHTENSNGSCGSFSDSATSNSSHTSARFPLVSSLPQSSSPASAFSSSAATNNGVGDMPPRNINPNCVTSSQALPTPKLELPEQKLNCSNKYAYGDHLLQVLTPSEIMKSLPDLKQDDCSGCAPSAMDQDKLLSGGNQPKTARVETQEERQWKQIQALRQQQSQQQQPPVAVGVGDPVVKDQGPVNILPPGAVPVTSQLPFQQGAQAQGGFPQRGVDGSVLPHAITDRLPHHVLASHEQQKLPPLHSSQMQQSQGPRAMVQMNPPQQLRSGIEMPPPVPAPAYGPRGAPQPLRSPVYTRMSYPLTPRTQAPSNDPFGHIQDQSNLNMQPVRSFNETDCVQPMPETSHYSQAPGNAPQGIDTGDIQCANRLSASPQGQETRQHLRDLLQRQQVKKLEQDQSSPTSNESNQCLQQRPAWAQDDWQKNSGDNSQMIRHPVGSPVSRPTHPINQFRQPFLPPHARVPIHSHNPVTLGQTLNRPNEFRMQNPLIQTSSQGMESRPRLIINQQQRVMIPIQNVNRQQQPGFHPQFHQNRNPLDPYGHLVVQQQRMQGGVVETQSNSMLAQQLGRPLNQQPVLLNQQALTETSQQQQILQPNQTSQPPPAQASAPDTASSSVPSPMQTDHQELPDNVTAELEKLEQEHEQGELPDLAMDDDELLGMGADFNILEYADPELDQVVGCEKTNILDNLDLEEEEKEEKEQKRKEEPERGSKKEDVVYPGASSGKQLKSNASPKSPSPVNRGLRSPPNQTYGGHPAQQLDGGKPMMRPAQPPPPPYPGPPPPYPGRAPQQMGIRNGCGVNINAMGGVKTSSIGTVGRPSYPQLLPPAALQPNSNPTLSLHQRRTLLLQEQPLLLEDLLEQEKREQLRQGSGLINAAPEEPLLSDFEFERLKADVFSTTNLPVSISPPNVVGQNMINMPSQQPSNILNRHHPVAGGEWQLEEGSMRRQDMQPVPIDNSLNVRSVNVHAQPPNNINPAVNATIQNRLPNFPPLQSLPPPPNPPEHPATEQERQMQIQYEQWLYSQQQVLTMHLKCFETEVHKLRKIKKSLNSKQRQLKKNGNELNETDAGEMERIGKELPGLQKQLDQARKQSRQHNLLMQDYRTKQQKRQQMMGIGPPTSMSNLSQGNISTQPSPLGAASSSPLHSTPQSPMLSPSPSLGGPSPSPLMQNSPMASPLTPSPGPSSSLSQTSPRGNPGVHILDDTPFSPNTDNSGRQLQAQNIRMQGQHHVTQIRMGNPGMPNHQVMMSQPGVMNINVGGNQGNAGHMMVRGINPAMVQQMQSQQRAMMETQHGMQRMRSLVPQDQMRNMNPMSPRFQRMGMHQDMMMRARPPSNFSNPNQMAMSPGGQQYSTVRVPFPSQSPTGSNMNAGSLRSPSPMTPICGLGSPPNQMMMAQSRASPSSSPMRRPSGSGSIGTASPMPERPQSVENPLTPRNSTSRPHTPSSVGVCQNMDGMSGQLPQHASPMDTQHYGNPESCGIANMGSPQSHYLQTYLTNMGGDNQIPQQNHQTTQDFSNLPNRQNPGANSNNNGGGGGGKNIQVLPFPVFSWFDGPYKMGLKGGNPVSVVTEHTPANSAVVSDHTPANTNQDPVISTITQVSQNTQGVVSANSTNSSRPVEDGNVSLSTELAPDSQRLQASSSSNACPSTTKNASCAETLKVDSQIVSNCTAVSASTQPTVPTPFQRTLVAEIISTTPTVKSDQVRPETTIAASKSGPSLTTGELTPTNYQACKLPSEPVFIDHQKPSIPSMLSGDLVTAPKQSSSLNLNSDSRTFSNCGIMTTQPNAFSLFQDIDPPKSGIQPVRDNTSYVVSIQQGRASSGNTHLEDLRKDTNDVPNDNHPPSSYSDASSKSSLPYLSATRSIASAPGQNSIMTSENSLVAEASKTFPLAPSSLPLENKSFPMSSAPLSSATNDSQNALLKQLLQNSGCASIGPTSEANSLSLAECLNQSMSPAIVPTHHLLEAATQIPTPTSSGISKSISSSLSQEVIVKPGDKLSKLEKPEEKKEMVVNYEASSVKPGKLDDKETTIGKTVQNMNQVEEKPKSSLNVEKLGIKFGKTGGAEASVKPSKLTVKIANTLENSDSALKVDRKIITSNEMKQGPMDGKASGRNDVRAEMNVKIEAKSDTIESTSQEQLPTTRPNKISASASIATDVGKGFSTGLMDSGKHLLKSESQVSPKSSCVNSVVGPVSPLTTKPGMTNYAGPTPLPAALLITEIKEERKDVENTLPEISLPKLNDSKKADEEVKKAKRRQYQSKRKQTATKEVVPKKRPRKSGKPEEDYDSYIENVMTQLRQLPPIGIVEPTLSHNHALCPVYGMGDFSKINNKDFDTRLGDLTGAFGYCKSTTNGDFYGSRPFGNSSTASKTTPAPSHRGFYHQEFAAPRTSSVDKSLLPSKNRTPSPVRESDTPDTIVSCSSPEFSDSGELFPALKPIESPEEKNENIRESPSMTIVCPVPIRPILSAKVLKESNDADKENSENELIMSKWRPSKENGNITVTLTLSSGQVDEIRGVLRNLANILSIPPPNYQVLSTNGPTERKLFTYKTKDGNQTVDIQSILLGVAKFCKHCDVVVENNGITKKSSEMPGLVVDSSESAQEDYYFCSSDCYVQFSISHGVTVTQHEKVQAIVKHINDAKVDVRTEKQSVMKDCRNGPMSALSKSNWKKDVHAVDAQATVEVSKMKRTLSDMENQDSEVVKKKWKGTQYKEWTPSCITTTHKYKKPTEKELTDLLFRLGITVLPNQIPEDTRRCIFCHQVGDGVSNGPGRLLNYDVDKWVHLNCALWSEEVYETENGALVNVEVAIKQSATLVCIICKQFGASVKCFKVRCTSVYHVGCAVKDGCAFYKNKSVYCQAHVPKGEKDNELTSLSVFRRVYIQRDENRQVAAVMHQVDQNHLLRVGSLIFLSVGQLLPHQLQSFHTRNYIYPVGYKIMRFYWSMTKGNKRCQYICSIHEADGKPEFRITAQEEYEKERVIKSDTAQGAWVKVMDAISKIRISHDLIKVFPKYITGEDLFGLTEPAIVKVLESLPGIETLTDYHFKYGRNPLLELPLAINPSGCARSEPKLRTHFKRPHTQRTGASRASLPSSVPSTSETAYPYSKQFVHSKSSQYKKMKQEWRNNVYLARSKIQGLGLYAARDIEKHTMVIEYIGEIIRNELAEAREKKYELQNRGIYMFRMDDERVIDATLCGGLARYVNHSCNPNCVAETVEVDRDVRIIIFANRRISRGEELAYDYKFEFEDDQHKIPCLCGAHNCQKWMN